jgi:hypothetical protein
MNQASQNWNTFAPEFYRDGSLRDIYVFNALLDDWTKAARFIVDRGYATRFSGAWTQSSFPSDIGTLFPEGRKDELTLLSVDVFGVSINCHFFSADEIEFDLNPVEISGPDNLAAVFDFMSGLANAVGKDVVSAICQRKRELRALLPFESLRELQTSMPGMPGGAFP